MTNGYNTNISTGYMQYGTVPLGGMMPPAMLPAQMNITNRTYNTTVQQPAVAQPPVQHQQVQQPVQIQQQPEKDSFIKSDAVAVTIGTLASAAAILLCIFAPAKASKVASETKPGFFARLKAKRKPNPLKEMKKQAKLKAKETKLKAEQQAQEAIQKVDQEILEAKLKAKQEKLEASLKKKQEKLEKKLEKKRAKIS